MVSLRSTNCISPYNKTLVGIIPGCNRGEIGDTGAQTKRGAQNKKKKGGLSQKRGLKVKHETREKRRGENVSEPVGEILIGRRRKSIVGKEVRQQLRGR